MKRSRRRKCLCCGQLYEPDPRNRRHQKFCSQPACRQSSKTISQRRWRRSLGRDYFRRKTHLDRVRKWRENHPGYWRKHRKKGSALQDVLLPQSVAPKGIDPVLNEGNPKSFNAVPSDVPSTAASSEALQPQALQDVIFTLRTQVTGLIAHLTGALQEDIAHQLNRMSLLGRQFHGPRPGAAYGGRQTSTVP